MYLYRQDVVRKTTSCDEMCTKKYENNKYITENYIPY